MGTILPVGDMVWGGILIMLGLSVGDLEGTRVGSFVRGEMVGESSGSAGQNTGQALAMSPCDIIKSGREIAINEI